MGTYVCKAGEAQRKWVMVDAEGQTLGRLSTHVAKLLMGKHRPGYTPFLDTGDFVVVINADKVRLTGRKETDKIYRWHTGYPGGLKQVAAGRMRQLKPSASSSGRSRHAAEGEPGRRLGMKLKTYAGPDHPHQAQKPEKISIPA